MKVIKRDGRAVDYDRQKIAIAIGKANEEVPLNERASVQEIKEIMEYIESLGKKRMLVEDIQDIIEQKLMEIKRFNLAKKYIVYRYRRALVRKQNTTDESILGLIRNNTRDGEFNKNNYLASNQRDYIASEVSRDLTKRLLLPEKITKADEEGILHFHNADYFIQPIFNSSIINISDMLDNGTVINGKMIESPKSFQVACIVVSQIIAAIANNQYGGQSIDIKHLGKYARKSYNKFKRRLEENYNGKISREIIENIAQDMLKIEIKAGVQTIQYQINTLLITDREEPFITLFLHLDSNDEYLKENAMIIEEILNQKIKGIKNENGIYETPVLPKLTYVLDECNNLTGGNYDYLTRLALKCSQKGNFLNYISAKIMKEKYEGHIFSPMADGSFLSNWKDEQGKEKFEGRFNQGLVTINLPQIALIADGNEEIFWKELEQRLEFCKDALMCRHYALLGTISDISPLHWQHGAISRFVKEEKIDKLLKDGYSTLSLGYIGLYETTKLIKGVSHTTKDGHDFAIKLMKKLRDTTKRWSKDTGLSFLLYGTSSDAVCYKFAQIDKERFGTIKDITDKTHYINSYHIDNKEDINLFDKLIFESEFQALSDGGGTLYIDLNNSNENIENIIHFIYNNVLYVELK